MKNLKKKLFTLLNNYLPILFFVILIIIFFWKAIFKGLVPIPADLVVGAYFPWLDYKWGYDVGVPVKNPITSDVVSVIYPIRSYAVDLIKKGESVLWNPLMFGGYPLLANFQIAIFSPTNFLYLILPKISAWTSQIIIQPLLAMFFSYILLNHLKISKFSSFMGSVVFAFSGFNIIWMEWGAHSLAAAFIPLIIYLVSKVIEEKRIYWGVLLSVATSAQIFSGYPQLFVYTVIAVMLYIFMVHQKGLTFRVLSKIFLFISLGIVGSSIQLLPAIELLRNSQRVSENLSLDLIYLPWQSWITFLAPDFFGNHSTGNFWGAGNYTNVAGYSGIVALCLAIFSISFFKTNRYIKYFSVLFVVSLFLSFPFPWTKYLYSLNLPGIGASSLTRILILTNLSIAYLSAFGLEFLIKQKSKRLTYITLFFILIIILLFLFSYLQYRNGNLLYLISIKNLILPTILIFSVFILSLLHSRYKKYSKIFTILIVTISIFELFRFGWKYTPFSKKSLIFPETPITSYLRQNNNLSRTHFGEVIPTNMWTSYELSSISGYDAVYPLSIAKYIAVVNSDQAISPVVGRYGKVDNINSRLFNLANNKYLLKLSIDKILIDKNKFVKVFEDKSVAILENKDALPRIFFVSDWEVIKDDEKVLERLLDSEFDIKNKIIISEDFDKFKNNKILPRYLISNIDYNSGKLSFDITTDKNGFIFISDTYYPGWKVLVDGELQKIYRADYTFRAVSVLSGEHNILFIYDPESFRIGILVSVSTLLILILSLIYGYKKNR